MAERIELNEEQLDDVVGGAFNFRYNSKGAYICKVDGVGTYYASENAKRQLAVYEIGHPGLSDADLVAWAVAQGLFWR